MPRLPRAVPRSEGSAAENFSPTIAATRCFRRCEAITKTKSCQLRHILAYALLAPSGGRTIRNRHLQGKIIVAKALNFARGGRVATQAPTHSSHMKTCGPATKQLTCSAALPQNEQYDVAFCLDRPIMLVLQ